MNIGKNPVKSRVSFSILWFGIVRDFQGEVVERREKYSIVDFWINGEYRQIQLRNELLTPLDFEVSDWWDKFVTVVPNESIRVLGDSIDDDDDDEKSVERLTDSLGRGLKGKGHGSIDWKKVERKRKSGKVWITYQPWYQWEDEAGKHCRYLKKGMDVEVQRLLDEGATVSMILESIGKSKNQSKGKTR